MADEQFEPSYENSEIILYLLRLLVDSQSVIKFPWREVFKFIETTLSADRKEVLKVLEVNGFSSKINDDDEFQIYGIFSASISDKNSQYLYKRVIELLDQNQPVRDLILSLSLNYGFTKAIISILISRGTSFGRMIRSSPIFALCSSDQFLESDDFNKYSRKQISMIIVDPKEYYDLLKNRWFVDILEVLASGFYGTETYSIVNSVQALWSDEDLEGLERTINSGLFLRLFSNRSAIIGDLKIERSLSYKNEQEKRNRHLKSFYHWLGIANDFSLGLEFLVGSIEFLPNMNEEFGVFLFIAGSVQLTARAIISIVSGAHLSARQRKIMKNL